MRNTNLKPSKTGRPCLSDYEKGILFASLSGLTPKTPEFREKRRELAVLLKRTERSIELNFARLEVESRGADTPSGPVTAGDRRSPKEV